MTTPAKPRRLGRFVLVASLALNVLLAGVMIGSVVSGRAGPPRSFVPQFGPLGQVLTKEQRAEVGRDLRRAIRNAGLGRPERNDLVRSVVGILEAETFDAAAFTAVMNDQYANLDGLRTIALATISDYFNEMSVEERRMVARNLAERGFRKGGPKDRGSEGE